MKTVVSQTSSGPLFSGPLLCTQQIHQYNTRQKNDYPVKKTQDYMVRRQYLSKVETIGISYPTVLKK